MLNNEAVANVDCFGLIGLTLSYDVAKDGKAPFGVPRISSLAELLADAQKKVKDCDCIELLRIGGHGRCGSINDNVAGGFDLNNGTFEIADLVASKPGLINNPANKSAVEAVQTLKSIASLMCPNGKLELISCNSFRGSEGRLFLNNLETIFGPGNIKGYTFSVKWGLLGGVEIIIKEKPIGDRNVTIEKVPAHAP